MKRTNVMMSAAVACFLLMPLPAYGGGHTWRFSEIFSNPDGTIMYIELVECCGLPGEYLVSVMDSVATGNTYLFPAPISCGGCSTANATLLVATAGFDALPAPAPTPDYILPDSFFRQAGDTLTYSIYDTMVFGPVPTNGVNSMLANGTIAVNSPKNLAGDTDNVNVRCKDSDFNFTGGVDVVDLLRLLAEWGSCPPPCDLDTDCSGEVNVVDLLALLGEWGDCPPP